MAPTSKDGSRRGNCPLFSEETVMRRGSRVECKCLDVTQLEGKFWCQQPR